MKLSSYKSQQGDALLESLIGIVLAAVIGLGLTYVASRTLAAQRIANTHGMAVSSLRQTIQTVGLNALCGGTASKITINTTDYALNTNCTATTAITVTANAETVTIPAAAAPTTSFTVKTQESAAAKSLFGGNGEIVISQ